MDARKPVGSPDRPRRDSGPSAGHQVRVEAGQETATADPHRGGFEMQAPLSDPLPPKAGKWIAQLQYGRPVKTDTAIRFHSTSASGGFSQFFRNQQRLRTYYS